MTVAYLLNEGDSLDQAISLVCANRKVVWITSDYHNLLWRLEKKPCLFQWCRLGVSRRPQEWREAFR